MTYKKRKSRTGWHKQSGALGFTSLFSAFERQEIRIAERKSAKNVIRVHVGNVEFEVFRGVYQTSIDTELMSQGVKIGPKQKFLEVGCGCGAVSLLLATRCKSGLGVDINPGAVENSIWNRARLKINNVNFCISDVFEQVQIKNERDKFDVIICNPPYNFYDAKSPIERMFWDPNDEMKKKFFKNAKDFLKKNGRIYFGWADFSDINGSLPLRLAEEAGLKYVRHIERETRNGLQRFFVIVFRPDKAVLLE